MTCIRPLTCYVFLSLMALALILGGTGCDQHSEQKKAILKTWTDYNTALANTDGQTAARLLSKASIDRYQTLIRKGLDAKSAEVLAMSPCDMAEILTMRNRATRAQLNGYAGKGYVIYAVNNGWWGAFDESEDWRFKVTKVEPDRATAVLTEIIHETVQRLPSMSLRGMVRNSMTSERTRKGREYTITFVNEDGWKLEESSMLARVNQEIQTTAKAARLSVRDFLMFIEEEDSGKEVKASIWDPMRK